MSEGQSYIITGGTGFIGRHLVKYLVDNNIASKIRVADKVMPIMAYMNETFANAFKDERVEFIQADLSKEAHLKKVFNDEEAFDIVVNLAGETCYGKDDSIYKQQNVNVAEVVGKAAVAMKVKKFIEISTAQVYKSGKKQRKEKKETKPWTGIAKAKLEAEEILKGMEGLPLVILRPSIVYGVGDMYGMSPRIVCAATYTETKEKMKLLYTGDMRINCVNVLDVVRAIEHAVEKLPAGTTYNVSDKSDMTQKKFNEHLTAIFGIKTAFFGTILSKLAQTRKKEAVEMANDQHMTPWNAMKKKSKIRSSPLSPFIDSELLSNHWLSVDGSAIEATGFTYQVPQMETKHVNEIIEAFQKLRLFPEFKSL